MIPARRSTSRMPASSSVGGGIASGVSRAPPPAAAARRSAACAAGATRRRRSAAAPSSASCRSSAMSLKELRQRALLRGALDGRAAREVAGGDPPRDGLQPLAAGGRARADDHARRRRARSPARPRPTSASPPIAFSVARSTAVTLWVTRTAPSDSAPRAIGTAVASSVLVQRVAAPALLHGVAAQRAGDLRARAVVLARRRRPGAVGQHACRRGRRAARGRAASAARGRASAGARRRGRCRAGRRRWRRRRRPARAPPSGPRRPRGCAG